MIPFVDDSLLEEYKHSEEKSHTTGIKKVKKLDRPIHSRYIMDYTNVMER
jgi:hypothetical protein